MPEPVILRAAKVYKGSYSTACTFVCEMAQLALENSESQQSVIGTGRQRKATSRSVDIARAGSREHRF